MTIKAIKPLTLVIKDESRCYKLSKNRPPFISKFIYQDITGQTLPPPFPNVTTEAQKGNVQGHIENWARTRNGFINVVEFFL